MGAYFGGVMLTTGAWYIGGRGRDAYNRCTVYAYLNDVRQFQVHMY